MLIDHLKAIGFQRRAELSPHLPFTLPNVPTLLEQIRATLFPTISARLDVFFIDGSFVACICHSPLSGATIFIHDILNRPEVPFAVFEYILTHELIHLVVRPREIDGKMSAHPPEFWEMERELSPDREAAFSWLWLNFFDVLREDKENECIRVKRNWRRAPQLIHVLPWEKFQNYCDHPLTRTATL